MGTTTSHITSLTIIFSTVYPGADQRKYGSSTSLAFVRGIRRGPVNSPHKWPVTPKMFPFDEVIMVSEKSGILASVPKYAIVSRFVGNCLWFASVDIWLPTIMNSPGATSECVYWMGWKQVYIMFCQVKSLISFHTKHWKYALICTRYQTQIGCSNSTNVYTIMCKYVSVELSPRFLFRKEAVEWLCDRPHQLKAPSFNKIVSGSFCGMLVMWNRINYLFNG